ncbi:MAG: hypothetical protein HDS72_03155 [Bacteroidales bacterium]|nr:hypothetical protein [Bacteroidales bacterium]
MKIQFISYAKAALAALALASGVLAAQAAEGVGVIVVKADGTSYEIELAQVDRINFGSSDVEVVGTSGQSQEFAYADVDRIMLGSPLSGISFITSEGNIAVWPKTVSSTLNIAGAQPGTEVRVYTIGGQLAASGRCSDGTLTLDLGNAPAGVCIVAVGNFTVKIIKQ